MINEADANLTSMAMNAAGMGPAPDDRVYAEFKWRPHRNSKRSLEEGRDIFEDRAYIKIMVPGDKDNIVERPVRDSDKQRFPRQWAAFEQQDLQPLNGTPLTEWAGMSRSQVEELKFFNIRTVEDLANMPDSQSSKFMGINSLRQKAKAWIEDAKYAAPFEQLRQENESLKHQMTEMQAELGMLKTQRKADTAQLADDDEPPTPPKARRKRRSQTDGPL